MSFLSELWGVFLEFMALGGYVLWLLMFLLAVTWALLFERVWYYKTALRKEVFQLHQLWAARPERKSKRARQIRRKMISQVNLRIDQYLPLIKTLIALAPIFGLLGTVTGMIRVFDVMTITGGSDAKALSMGVSMATIPAMSGMVAALSGVFGFIYLDRLAKQEKQLFEDDLSLE